MTEHNLPDKDDAPWLDTTYDGFKTEYDLVLMSLPKEQSAAGSQNAYVECTVEGYNDCLNEIKGKLTMTNEQIEMLRLLIQDEIEIAGVGVDGMEDGAWDLMDSQLDKRWKQFQESFNDTP
jgi:hypothetical protein